MSGPGGAEGGPLLAGKVAIITGAGGGIGRSTALLFSACSLFRAAAK